MLDLHQRLSIAIDAMSESQKAQFWQERKSGSPIEAQLNCAEKVLGRVIATESARARRTERETIELRESFRGRRNNGAGWGPEDQQLVRAQQLRENTDRILHDYIGLSKSQVDKVQKRAPKEIREAGAQVERDYQFLLGVGFSESDAAKGALADALRTNRRPRRGREVVKD